MKCPNCHETLLISERNQIEIDYCPQCRGVWLDKGELDKMMEFVERGYSARQQERPFPPTEGAGDRYRYQQKPYKKKSVWGDLFDFD